MTVKTVWGAYFSATGTTQKVVSCVAKSAAGRLGAAYRPDSFSLPAERRGTRMFSQEDLVVLGVPVYAGRVPNRLLPFLGQSLVGGGAYAIPIVLFGNRNYDDALIELRGILQHSGFHTISAGAFVGEHSFSAVLGAGRPDAGDLKLAARLGVETARKLLALDSVPPEPVAVAGNECIRPYYTPRDRQGNPIDIRKVKPKTNPGRCSRCGKCALACTMGAIDPKNIGEVPGVCIKCCACIKGCPSQAKYFDDQGYLYHKRELEQTLVQRADVDLFL